MMTEVTKQTSQHEVLQTEGGLDALLDKAFRPKTATQRAQIDEALAELARYALHESTVISENAASTITAMIASLDALLTAQVDEVLHNARFQEVEGAWRGLHHLVSNSETDAMLQIKVLNVSKKELAKSLRSFRGVAWDQSPLFKKVYGEQFDMPGGHPFGCLIGDYYFDHSPGDVELLGQIAQVAAASHAPFIAGASPTVLGMDSWQELGNPKDINNIFTAPDYAAWRSLRSAEDAKYVGLAMPRFLARLPYGAKTDPVDGFDFEEDTSQGDHNRYTWANAAYAMAVNINRSFKEHGWCTSIRGLESGGVVEGLPVHTFPSDDGGVDVKCPTEIAIGDRRDGELQAAGFIPLRHYKNSDVAVFFAADSLQSPQKYQGKSGADATASARLAAKLPYLFATCRFAHYLKHMVRDKLGTFKERDDMDRYLSEWIQDYVLTDPSTVGEEQRAKKPLQSAEVEVLEVEGNPGYYTAKFFLRPHFQLEGCDVALSLVSRLPSVARQG
jgi:type VI secretion system protein ImpC